MVYYLPYCCSVIHVDIYSARQWAQAVHCDSHGVLYFPTDLCTIDEIHECATMNLFGQSRIEPTRLVLWPRGCVVPTAPLIHVSILDEKGIH